MWLHGLLVNTIVAVSQAYAHVPILWGKGRFAVSLSSSTFPNRAAAPTQRLKIGNLRSKMFSSLIPRFAAGPDNAITLDTEGWCVEASGAESGNAVFVNSCTGGPTQRWSWLPLGDGIRNQIQLEGTHQCLDVSDKEGSLDGAPIELQNCEWEVTGSRNTQSWILGETISLPIQVPSQRLLISSSVRHMVVVVSMGLLGLVSINAWLLHRHKGPRLTASISQGGVCLTEPHMCQSSTANSYGNTPMTLPFLRHGAPLALCSPESLDEDTDPVLSVNPALDFSLPYRVLAFYVLVPVTDPSATVEAHREFLVERGMVGRVYICSDGINAQVSGITTACEEYRTLVVSEFPSTKILFKEDPIDELAFPRLRVKAKELVPSPKDGTLIDLNARGEDVTPETWDAMLADKATPKAVLDVRNTYEWDVGRFDGADRPSSDVFADFDAESYGLPSDPQERKKTPVMMYCTGGIRCEYFSARLKSEGFENVYKLQGGVQHYGNVMANKSPSAISSDVEPRTKATDCTTPSDAKSQTRASDSGTASDAEPRASASGGVPHWKGSLFVFDRRTTLPVGDSDATPVGECIHCGAISGALVNCVNVDCNKIHVTCQKCFSERQGACCEACTTAPRRRPLAAWAATEDGEIDIAKVMQSTQGWRSGEADPNKLSTFKPHNLSRKDYNADEHWPPQGKARAPTAMVFQPGQTVHVHGYGEATVMAYGVGKYKHKVKVKYVEDGSTFSCEPGQLTLKASTEVASCRVPVPETSAVHRSRPRGASGTRAAVDMATEETAETLKGCEEASETKRVQIFVSGKVQGVYYRDTTKRKGDILKLVGKAWNLDDGRVEILAEGRKDKLEELLQWCWMGPEGATEVGMSNSLTACRRVMDVEASWSEARGDLGSSFVNGGNK